MTGTQPNNIIKKLSLSKRRVPHVHDFTFPEMPKLYLELVENKKKVKQQLVNKEYNPTEYIPDDTPSFFTTNQFEQVLQHSDDYDYESISKADDIDLQSVRDTNRVYNDTVNNNRVMESSGSEDENIKNLLNTPDEEDDSSITSENTNMSGDISDNMSGDNMSDDISDNMSDDNMSDNMSDDKSDDNMSGDKSVNIMSVSDKSPSDKDSVNYSYKSDGTKDTTGIEQKSTTISVNENDDFSKPKLPPLFSNRQPQNDTFQQILQKKIVPLNDGTILKDKELYDKQTHIREEKPQLPNLSDRIKQSETFVPSHSKSIEKIKQFFQKPPSQYHQRPVYNQQHTQPPPLKEIHNEKVVPNLNYMSSTMEDEDAKRELLFKFELLKKNNRTVDIPEFTIHSDLKSMRTTYHSIMKRMSIESSVENYKTYLIGGFMAVEYALGNWMGFDMQGFTQQQIVSMDSYERLLIELGEKSYVEEEQQWPVEARLLGLIVMNAAFFVISKIITKKTGTSILNMINSMNTQKQSTNVPPKKTRHMKGPNIDLSNIPDI